MDDFFGIISVIVFGCGIYGFYAYFQMKRDGHINETLLLGKSYTEQMCKDKELSPIHIFAAGGLVNYTNNKKNG